MGRRASGAWFLAAALVAAPASGEDEPGFRRSADFQKRVDAAIAKGVEWLRSAQHGDGGFSDDGTTWSGGPAFAYLAMRACKVPADDPAAAKAFDAMRRKYLSQKPKSDDELTTEEAATYAMALAEHGTPTGARDASGEARVVLSAADLAWMKEIVKFLEEMQRSDGSFSYCREQKKEKDEDAGESQRALLGLKAASRAGVKAKTETWTKAMQAFFDVQESKGPVVPRPGTDGKGPKNVDHARGFGSPREKKADLSVFDWNVSDGVSSVVICRGELSPDPKKRHASDAKAETSIRDGIAWLGKDMDELPRFDVAKARAEGADHVAYVVVYSMERACDLAGVDRVGTHDWYGEGAEYLMALQDSKGSWGLEHVPKKAKSSPGEAIEATCSALLFLSRSTPFGGTGAITKAPDDSDINFGVVATLGDKDFEDFLGLVLSRWRRVEDAAVKERLFAKSTAVGPRIVPPLVRRLSSEKDDERASAFALLKRATGLDHGYDPAADKDARDAAAAKWQTWWTENSATLHFDEASGKLVP